MAADGRSRLRAYGSGQMAEIATATKRDRELVATHVDPEQHAALVALARSEDRSISSVLRRAIAAELERADQGQARAKPWQ
jgi:ribbon-helix-helix CopG family protein